MASLPKCSGAKTPPPTSTKQMRLQPTSLAAWNARCVVCWTRSWTLQLSCPNAKQSSLSPSSFSPSSLSQSSLSQSSLSRSWPYVCHWETGKQEEVAHANWQKALACYTKRSEPPDCLHEFTHAVMYAPAGSCKHLLLNYWIERLPCAMGVHVLTNQDAMKDAFGFHTPMYDTIHKPPPPCGVYCRPACRSRPACRFFRIHLYNMIGVDASNTHTVEGRWFTTVLRDDPSGTKLTAHMALAKAYAHAASRCRRRRPRVESPLHCERD